MGCFQLEQIEYGYERQPVLRGIDLTLEPGRILGLFGHNGAGKTTTIKLILGLMAPDRGRVTVLGGRPGSPEVARQIGYLPENVMFYPQLSGREILAHFARLKGAPLAQVPDLLEQVGLAHAQERRVATYSKGMKQRLGLAQALLGNPQLLMLDEPTTGLDPVATAELYRLLRRLRDAGTGIVLCSHVLPGVEPYIDEAAILAGGQLLARGDLPALRRTAGMPVRLRAQADNLDALLPHLDGRVPPLDSLSRDSATIELDVCPADKLATLRALLAIDALADLHIHQPTLEDLYCHFTGAAGGGH